MATLSKERRDWIQKIYGNEAAIIIREIESLPTQDQANKMVTRLKDQVNESHRLSGAASNQHPGLSYFGTAFKSNGSKPTVTLAEIQKKAKALSAAIKSTAQATKDAAESAEAAALLELMDLADDLELSQEGVLELVRQYSMVEVTSILRTLSGQKSTGKGFKSAFFGVETDRADIADINLSLQQSRKSNRFWR